MMTPPLEKAGWWAGLAAAPRTLGLLFHWGGGTVFWWLGTMELDDFPFNWE